MNTIPPPALTGEKIIQVSPGPARLVVNSSVLNILAGDNVNGLAGVDPAKLGPPERPPRLLPKEQQQTKPKRKQKQSQ